MFNISFSDPREINEFIKQCCVVPDREPIKTTVEVTPDPKNEPKAVQQISTSRTLSERERGAAKIHWEQVLNRFHWEKGTNSVSYIASQTKEWLPIAHKWYASHSDKEKYAIMRGPDVSSYSQCDAAWDKLSDYEKASLCHWAHKFPTLFGKIKEQFLSVVN
jgi:hypothetical protein